MASSINNERFQQLITHLIKSVGRPRFHGEAYQTYMRIIGGVTVTGCGLDADRSTLFNTATIPVRIKGTNQKVDLDAIVSDCLTDTYEEFLQNYALVTARFIIDLAKSKKLPKLKGWMVAIFRLHFALYIIALKGFTILYYYAQEIDQTKLLKAFANLFRVELNKASSICKLAHAYIRMLYTKLYQMVQIYGSYLEKTEKLEDDRLINIAKIVFKYDENKLHDLLERAESELNQLVTKKNPSIIEFYKLAYLLTAHIMLLLVTMLDTKVGRSWSSIYTPNGLVEVILCILKSTDKVVKNIAKMELDTNRFVKTIFGMYEGAIFKLEKLVDILLRALLYQKYVKHKLFRFGIYLSIAVGLYAVIGLILLKVGELDTWTEILNPIRVTKGLKGLVERGGHLAIFTILLSLVMLGVLAIGGKQIYDIIRAMRTVHITEDDLKDILGETEPNKK